MRIKEITVGKEMKLSLPKFSNTTASCYLTIELGEGEKPNWEAIWDELNQQIFMQLGHIEPMWIIGEDSKKWAEFTVKKILKRK